MAIRWLRKKQIQRTTGFLLLALFIYLVAHRDARLLTLDNRVVDLPPPGGFWALRAYSRSLSDHTLLLDMNYGKSGGCVMVSVDTKTHAVAYLPELSAALCRLKPRHPLFAYADVSRDGKWLLIDGGSHHINTVYAVSTDGRCILTMGNRRTDGVLSWLANGRQWVEITPKQIVRHDVASLHTQTVRVCAFPCAEQSSLRVLFSKRGYDGLELPEHLVILHDHCIYQLDDKWYDLDLHGDPVTPRLICPTCRPGATPEHDMAFSPDGHLVAWLTKGSCGVSSMEPVKPTASSRFFKTALHYLHLRVPDDQFEPAPDCDTELWVAPTDGGPPRQIGQDRLYMMPRDMIWSQDSRAIYIRSRNADDPLGGRTLRRIPVQ